MYFAALGNSYSNGKMLEKGKEKSPVNTYLNISYFIIVKVISLLLHECNTLDYILLRPSFPFIDM